MSQVRKLLNGNGGIPRTYNLILDGQTFTIDDDQLTQINNEIASLDPRYRAYLGGVSGAITSGVFVGDRAQNKISTPALSNLNDKEMEFLKAGKQNLWEAITDSNTYRAKEAINEALNIVARVVNKKPETKSEASSKNIAHNRKANFDYDTIDGKQVFSTNPINGLITDRFKSYLDWLSDEKWGDTNQWEEALGDNEAVLRSWYNNLGSRELAQSAINEAMNEVRSKPWDEVSEATKELLKYFNIGNGESTSIAIPKSDIQKQLETDFKDNPRLYDYIKDNFVKDKDGVWRLRPDGVFNLGFDLAPGQGIWFNDDFYKSKLGADLRLSPLKGLTYYNGALYTQDSPILASILNAENGYNQLMSEGRWDEANNIIWSDFTDLQRRVPTRLSENQYNKFLSDNPQYLFSNITGVVKNLVDEEGNPYTLGPDEDIIQYVDLDNPMMVGPYKRYKFDYRVIDKTGNTDKLISKFDEIPRATAKAFSAWYPRITNSDNEQYNGRYFINVKDQYGNDTDYAFYVNPDNQDDVYFHIPNLKARGINSTDDIALPPTVAKKLLQTKDKWLPNVISNSENQKLFGQFISKLLQPKYRQAGFSWIPWNINAYREFFNSDKDTLRDLGLDKNDVDEIVNAMHEAYSKGSAEERIARHRRIPPASINKKGGKIEYISKLANGGVSGATNDISNKKNSDKVSIKKVNPNNPAPLTHIGQEDWQDADTMDLIALIGDLGSLAAAFVPGANTASAAIGAGSSFSRFGADLARDKNWLSATGGLLLNLTMDAATLLPFAGGLAKDVKTITAIKKALPTIIKAASIYGLGSAVVESANKIANNESWTTRDVANLINGLTAVTGIYRQGFGKGKKTITTNEMSVPTKVTGKVDLKGKSIKLTSKEIDKIAKLDKSKQAEAMDNLLWEKVKKMSGKPDLSKEDALAAVDRSQFDSDHRNWNPFRKGFLKTTTDFELGNTSTITYNKSTKREGYNNAIIYGNQKASTLPPRIPNKSNVRVSTGKATGPDGFIYNINEAPVGSTPIYRTYQGRVVKPSDQQLVPVADPTIQATRYSIATPQLFGPQYFRDEPEHSTLPRHKKGGVIKAQSGLKFSVPSEIEVPSNLSTDLINKIAYRPNTDWGTYVNGKYTPFGSLGPYQLKYETNAQRYDDARQAFTDAYGFSYDPQSKSYLSEYGKKDVIEQPVEESLPGNETPLPELNDGWHTPTANDAVQDIAAAIGQKIPAKASSSSTIKKNNINLGGGYNDNISDKTKWINPLISTFRYGLNAWAQRKYTDQAIKAINAGRYDELPVWQNLPVMTNPTLDRQLQQVHLERMAGMKPVTSDLIANNALWNQRESQLYDRENDIYGKQSAFQWDVAREGLNIMNQNIANQVKVANENRAKSAALNSAIEQQKMAFIQMLNQSRQNALLEVQNNVMNDRKTMLAYEQNQYNQQLQRDYDSYLRSTYSDAAYNYSKLDYNERSKYIDLEDYILRNVPGSAEDISTERSKILNKQLSWNRDNALNYNYGFLAGRTSSVGNRTYKKGGRVNGTTRYTLDPDERIWIDNNKAAHAGVAKLSDNVIKLILRALK